MAVGVRMALEERAVRTSLLINVFNTEAIDNGEMDRNNIIHLSPRI